MVSMIMISLRVEYLFFFEVDGVAGDDNGDGIAVLTMVSVFDVVVMLVVAVTSSSGLIVIIVVIMRV